MPTQQPTYQDFKVSNHTMPTQQPTYQDFKVSLGVKDIKSISFGMIVLYSWLQ
jgi:hypothetical protein